MPNTMLAGVDTPSHHRRLDMQKSIVRFWSHTPRWALVALAFVLALLLAPQRAFGQACEDPKVLRFSIIPTQESVRELTLYKPVLDPVSYTHLRAHETPEHL